MVITPSNSNMSSPRTLPPTEDEAIPSSIGRRDRSYSDAHALLIFSSKTDNSSPSNKPDISMGSNIENHTNSGSGSPTRMVGSMKKCHSHGNRPRSKSFDLHKLHKKKAHSPHQNAKHHVMSHSPHGGRYSPSSPKLTGKCWVRKASNNASSPISFIPTLASGPLARSPTSPTYREYEHQVGDRTTTDPASTSPTRQVTTESQLVNTNSFDDELTIYPSRNSLSFEALQHSCEPQFLPKPNSIRRDFVWGASGRKVIKPRSAFEQYTTSATA